MLRPSDIALSLIVLTFFLAVVSNKIEEAVEDTKRLQLLPRYDRHDLGLIQILRLIEILSELMEILPN